MGKVLEVPQVPEVLMVLPEHSIRVATLLLLIHTAGVGGADGMGVVGVPPIPTQFNIWVAEGVGLVTLEGQA